MTTEALNIRERLRLLLGNHSGRYRLSGSRLCEGPRGRPFKRQVAIMADTCARRLAAVLGRDP